jgi:putative endopeptidase
MQIFNIIFILINLCFLPALNASDPIHLDWLDKSRKPEENFFLYANGNWIKNNPIPEDYPSWNIFSILQEKVQNTIHRILIQAANNPKVIPGSDEQKIGDFYFSAMDTEHINSEGVTPLKEQFERIDNIKSINDWINTLSYLHLIGVDAVFNFGSMQDFTDSEKMIAAAQQDGLGLPDRDYYLNQDQKSAAIRLKYIQHITRMFQLLKETPDHSVRHAQAVMSIETALAKSSLSKIELRDPHAIYHMKNIDGLALVTPNFSWPKYLSLMGCQNVSSMNLAMPTFFKAVNSLLTSVSLDDWKAYFRWHLLASFAPYLSDPFVKEHFYMRSVITGVKSELPRWKKVVNAENNLLGFAVGKLYVKEYFPPSSRQSVIEILHHIRSALENDLNALTWMTPSTRKAALSKLSLMGERVGYPNKWWDYSSLKVDRGPYVSNVLRAHMFLIKRDLNKIGKLVDKTEWAMTPQTVNAYYDPSMNNINIPAGILQSPFFDPDAPAALNYGGIGFVIGHEMTHGFDDEGAQFDGHGNLQNWWSQDDLKKFHEATACIINQFSQYSVDGDLHVQGKLVAGEATADLGGVLLAYRAFRYSKAFWDAKTINGISPIQQFFIGAAHIWANNIRPEEMRHLVTTDPHPLAQDRVNGTLRNIPDFANAFHIPSDSPMVSQHRCVIW